MKLQYVGLLPVIVLYLWSFWYLFGKKDKDDVVLFIAFILFGIGTVGCLAWVFTS